MPPERKPAVTESIRNVRRWAYALFSEPTPLQAFAKLAIPILYMLGTRSPESSAPSPTSSFPCLATCESSSLRASGTWDRSPTPTLSTTRSRRSSMTSPPDRHARRHTSTARSPTGSTRRSRGDAWRIPTIQETTSNTARCSPRTRARRRPGASPMRRPAALAALRHDLRLPRPLIALDDRPKVRTKCRTRRVSAAHSAQGIARLSEPRGGSTSALPASVVIPASGRRRQAFRRGR